MLLQIELTSTVASTVPEVPTSLMSGSCTVVNEAPVFSSTTSWVTEKLMNPFTCPFGDWAEPCSGRSAERRRRRKGATTTAWQPGEDNTSRSK